MIVTRGTASLSAPILAGIAIATLELVRVPGLASDRIARGELELVLSAARTFVGPALLVAVALGLAAATPSLPTSRRRWARAASIGIGIGLAALAREGLLRYGPFAWSVPATLAMLGWGILLAALAMLPALALPAPTRAVLGGVAALGGLALVPLQYRVYVGLYPTLHEAVLELAFVSVALGIGAVLLALRARVVPLVALALAAILACASLAIDPREVRPLTSAHTELGRADNAARRLRTERDWLFPTALPDPAARPAPDPDADARFARESGLPDVAFALDDYDVLLILSDATRADRTSLTRRDGPTPRLAALGRESVVLTRAYAPSSCTFPSLGALFSMAPVSSSPLDIEERHWRGRLRATERASAAEALRAAGRRTFWIGHDLEGSMSEHADGLARGFDERVLVPEVRGAPSDARVDDAIAERAVRTIASHEGERWLGLVFFVSPHDDYRVHDPRAPHETPLERYDQELRQMDAALGRVLDAIDLDRTIVVFAGDHGEAFGEHGPIHHSSSVYDEQVRVPLVLHVPVVAPRRSDAPTSLVYVLPWLMLRGRGPERARAELAVREDIGPWMRALDGAVLSELIGPNVQSAALIREDETIVYDVLADLARLYDAGDRGQQHDLRDEDARRYARARHTVTEYLAMRRAARRFRFEYDGASP